MPNTQSNIRQRWRDIAKADHRNQLTAALAELRQIDEDIDYSFQESMQITACGRGRGNYSRILSQEVTIRRKFRERKYEILAGLFSEALGK